MGFDIRKIGELALLMLAGFPPPYQVRGRLRGGARPKTLRTV